MQIQGCAKRMWSLFGTHSCHQLHGVNRHSSLSTYEALQCQCLLLETLCMLLELESQLSQQTRSEVRCPPDCKGGALKKRMHMPVAA